MVNSSLRLELFLMQECTKAFLLYAGRQDTAESPVPFVRGDAEDHTITWPSHSPNLTSADFFP